LSLDREAVLEGRDKLRAHNNLVEGVSRSLGLREAFQTALASIDIRFNSLPLRD